MNINLGSLATTVGGFCVAVAKDFGKVCTAVVGIDQKVDAAAPTVEAVTGILSVPAKLAEEGFVAVLDEIADAITSARAAGQSGSVNVQLSATACDQVAAVSSSLQTASAQIAQVTAAPAAPSAPAAPAAPAAPGSS